MKKGLVAFSIEGNQVNFKAKLKGVNMSMIPTLIVVMELYIDDLKKEFREKAMKKKNG